MGGHLSTFMQHYTQDCAIGFCGGMIAYSHLVHLLTFIPKMANLKLPMELYGCRNQYFPNTPQVTYMSSLAIVLTAYPLIVYMRQKRIHSKSKVGSKVGHTNPTLGKTTRNMPSEETDPTGEIVSEIASKANKQKIHRSTQSFIVSTLMTCSILIFWAPVVILPSIQRFMPSPYPLLHQDAMTLLAVQPAIDPILFTIVMKDLRSRFLSMFCYRSTRRRDGIFHEIHRLCNICIMERGAA